MPETRLPKTHDRGDDPGAWYPPCFGDAESYHAWLYMARVSHFIRDDREKPQEKDHRNYCVDCTAAFQAAMLRRGECLHPEVYFAVVKGEGGLPIGIRPGYRGRHIEDDAEVVA